MSYISSCAVPSKWHCSWTEVPSCISSYRPYHIWKGIDDKIQSFNMATWDVSYVNIQSFTFNFSFLIPLDHMLLNSKMYLSISQCHRLMCYFTISNKQLPFPDWLSKFKWPGWLCVGLHSRFQFVNCTPLVFMPYSDDRERHRSY